MYSSSDATTEAARVFFISYAIFGTLLFAQLIIGVIVNLFVQIKHLNSEQLYSCLAEVTRTADESELRAMEDDILKLNTTMLPIHGALDVFTTMDNLDGMLFDNNGKSKHIFFQSLRAAQSETSLEHLSIVDSPRVGRTSPLLSQSQDAKLRGQPPLVTLVAELAR